MGQPCAPGSHLLVHQITFDREAIHTRLGKEQAGLHGEQLRWADENLTGRYSWDFPSPTLLRFMFEQLEDYVLFRLKWSVGSQELHSD